MTADASGSIFSAQVVADSHDVTTTVTLTATGENSNRSDVTAFDANASVDIDQCANGPLSSPVPCIGGAWQNGNLNGNQAHYLEGDSVPYREVFSDLTAAGPTC